MSKNANKIGLFQSPFRQFVLAQAKIMTQLVQKSRVNFVPKNLLIALGEIPKILQKQNNLWRQRNISLVGKFRPREQAQRVWLNSICLQTGVRLAFKRHWQLFRTLAQRLRQRRLRRLDLRQRHLLQMFPIRVHNGFEK